MGQSNNRCASVTGAGFCLQCLLSEGHEGDHQFDPMKNFDHDPRFDEGGEFHEEANGDEQMPESIQDDGSIAVPTANLQPSPSLAWRTLGVAQNIVKRVADSICSLGGGPLDKNQAYLDLQSAIGMMETALDALRAHEDEGGQ